MAGNSRCGRETPADKRAYPLPLPSPRENIHQLSTCGPQFPIHSGTDVTQKGRHRVGQLIIPCAPFLEHGGGAEHAFCTNPWSWLMRDIHGQGLFRREGVGERGEPGMYWKRGRPTPCATPPPLKGPCAREANPPPSPRAPSLRPATVPLTATAGFNSICNRW